MSFAAARRNVEGGALINASLLRSTFGLRTILPGRLEQSILLVATLLVAGLGVEASTSTAHAKECLAAPNSPAPEGSWWYYRLDWPTHRKCWYLRSLGKPAQHATEGATTGPMHSRSSPSHSIRATDRAPKSASSDDTAPSPPPETAPVGSIAPEVPAPKPVIANQNLSSAPETDAPPVVSPSTQPTVEQAAQEEITTQSIPEPPVQETSAPSQTDAQTAASADRAAVASPDVVPRIKALESSAVPTDASTPDYIETVVRSREQANANQIPRILFLVIPVGLVVIVISSFFLVRRVRTRRSA
jgi:hypothetical protein